MSLLEDVHDWYKEDSSPPDAGGLDMKEVDGEWVKGDTETKQISYEVIDDSPRWGDVIQIVFQRDDEIVVVEDVRPATENQDWGDYGEPTIYEARKVVEIVERVSFERLKS